VTSSTQQEAQTVKITVGDSTLTIQTEATLTDCDVVRPEIVRNIDKCYRVPIRITLVGTDSSPAVIDNFLSEIIDAVVKGTFTKDLGCLVVYRDTSIGFTNALVDPPRSLSQFVVNTQIKIAAEEILASVNDDDGYVEVLSTVTDCQNLFNSLIPPRDNICYSFTIFFFTFVGTQQKADDVIFVVEEALIDGTFTADTGLSITPVQCDCGTNNGCNQFDCDEAQCDRGNCNQQGATNASCEFGGCNQKGATNASCEGSGCNQDNTTGSATCRSDCSQRNTVNPECRLGRCCWDSATVDGSCPVLDSCNTNAEACETWPER